MTTSSTAEFNVSDVLSKTESVFPFSDVCENTKKRRGVYPVAVATDAADATSPEALPCTGETDVHSRCTGATADVAPRTEPLEIERLDVSWINHVPAKTRAGALIGWLVNALNKLKDEDYDAWDVRLGPVVSGYCEATLQASMNCEGVDLRERVLHILESNPGWCPTRKSFPRAVALTELHDKLTKLYLELKAVEEFPSPPRGGGGGGGGGGESKEISTWGIDDVGEWLKSSELGELVEKFAEAKVNGYELLRLTESDLRQSVHLNVSSERVRVIRAVNILRASAGVADVSPHAKPLSPLEIEALDVSWIEFIPKETRACVLIGWFMHCLDEVNAAVFDEPGPPLSVYCEATLQASSSCDVPKLDLKERVLDIFESTQGWDPRLKLFPSTCDLAQLFDRFMQLYLELKATEEFVRIETEERMQKELAMRMQLLDTERGT